MATGTSVDVRSSMVGPTAAASLMEPVITSPVASANASMPFQLMDSTVSRYQVIASFIYFSASIHTRDITF